LLSEEIERTKASFSEVMQEKGGKLFGAGGGVVKKLVVEGGEGGARKGDEEGEEITEQVEGRPSGRDKRRGKGRGSARGRGGEEMSLPRPSSAPAVLLASFPSATSSIFAVRPSSSIPFSSSDLPPVPTMDAELLGSIFDD
jgi:hypothetical protein